MDRLSLAVGVPSLAGAARSSDSRGSSRKPTRSILAVATNRKRPSARGSNTPSTDGVSAGDLASVDATVVEGHKGGSYVGKEDR